MGGISELATGVRLLLQMSTDSNRVTVVSLSRRVPPGMSTDTLRAGLIDVRGAPDSVSSVEPANSSGKVIWPGHWNDAREHVYAYEATLPDSSRWLTVNLMDRAAILRNAEQRGVIPLTPERFKPSAR